MALEAVGVESSRPFCELQYFQNDFPAGGDLPNEEEHIHRIQGYVEASRCITPFLHRWNKGCS
jgi:hypothetical protein